MHIQMSCLVAAAALLVAAPCTAQSAMMIRVSDLDLGSRSGAAIALQRMNVAAQRFCRGVPHELDYSTTLCRRDMTGRAVQKLRAERVAHLYMTSSAVFQMASR